MFSLNKRTRTPERMDAPELDRRAHAQALAGLRRLNRAADAARRVARPVVQFARAHGLSRLSLLDVACGGGDVSVGVARILRHAGVAVELTLTDLSPVALDEAAKRAADAGVAARTARGAAPGSLPEGEFDVVMCTLFLHHLSREDAVATLRAMGGRARHLVVACDLRRNALGFMLAWAMCRLVSRSPIVHFDGPVSVRAGWTLEEMSAMARDAGLPATILPCFPSRILLTADVQIKN